MLRMNPNFKAGATAALGIAVALIALGLGFDIYETGKFSDCVTTSSTPGRCPAQNRGGIALAALGAILFVGAGAALSSLRRSATSHAGQISE